jgi:hypothetical protein
MITADLPADELVAASASKTTRRARPVGIDAAENRTRSGRVWGRSGLVDWSGRAEQGSGSTEWRETRLAATSGLSK